MIYSNSYHYVPNIVYSNVYHYVPQNIIGVNQTPEQYYTTPGSLGNYQYVTLREVMDQMLIEKMDDDSFLKNTNRSKILVHAKQGIKKLTLDASKEVLDIAMTVSSDLVLPLPQDFVDYVMVCVVDVDRKLMPLNINSNINTATGYLQDSNGNIIFDSNSQIITADGSNAYGQPYNKYQFSDVWMGGYFETDVSKLSRYGEVTIDKRRGCMLFSSNLLDKEIVLHYYSDGLQWENLQDTEITIHKLLEEALKDWIYYACIERKRNVPANEKQRALLRYKTTRFKAVKDLVAIDINEISRMVSLGGKML